MAKRFGIKFTFPSGRRKQVLFKTRGEIIRDLSKFGVKQGMTSVQGLKYAALRIAKKKKNINDFI